MNIPTTNPAQANEFENAIVKTDETDNEREPLLVLRKNGDKLTILKQPRKEFSSLNLSNDISHDLHGLLFDSDCDLEDNICSFSSASDSESVTNAHTAIRRKEKYSVICDVCGLKFKGVNALTVHRKYKHTHVIKHECTFCGKSFRDSFCLKRHLRSVHTENGEIRENYRSINCSLCKFKAGEGKLVTKHYASVHGYEMVEEKIRFSSVSEFENWKKKMESGTCTRFVKFRGSRTNRNGTTVTVFNCHRSGFYHASIKDKVKRLRNLKSKGSNKINGYCPASISCIEYRGQVIVKFMLTHIGHDLEIDKIGLNSNEKDFIAEKLSSSIPMDKILQDLKESGEKAENKERIHVATRKDFYNIIEKYKLKGLAIYSQSKDEWKKFDSWIKEIGKDSNVVRFYKPQGQVHVSFSEFKNEDFCLILASDEQLEMLKLYGNQCICIDNVYKENKNDFELHTIMILDEMRESYPCVYIFSNRGDDNALRVYFQVIKSILNVELCPRYFMSDWANSILNAWTAVYKEVPFKNLFSRWHIEKEWKRNLPKIKPKEKQQDIFKKVKELSTLRNYSVFKVKAAQVLSELSNNYETKTYANYIQKIICEPSSWAYCFRVNAEINDSLNLDELHSNIEYFFVKGKKVKCLTKTAQVLMSYAEERIKQRLDHSFQERIHWKMNELISGHKMSLELLDSVIEITDEGWNVVSYLDRVESRHSVSREDSECNCGLICPECLVCVHAYSCSCTESSINYNMCRHIHLIAACIQNHTLTENIDVTAAVVEVQMVDIDAVNDKSNGQDYVYNNSDTYHEICIKSEDNIENDHVSSPFVAKKYEFIERLTQIVNQIETEEELDAVILQNSPLEEILQHVKEKKNSDPWSEMETPNRNKCESDGHVIINNNKEEFVDDNIEEAEHIACEVIVEC